MFIRQISSILQQAASTFPTIMLTGPRQSGKTTLLRELFKDYTYINLEVGDNQILAKQDPRGLLNSSSNGLILDEAQKAPELFPYIQEHIDNAPSPGRFILSGSENFLLANSVNQSLAGRAAVLELLPLSYQEFLSHPNISKPDIWIFLYNGTYPRPYHENLDTTLWYQSYIKTYLERDVRALINIRDLIQFQQFMKLCAGWHGQLLNLNAIAQNCGISHTTATKWLSVLESSFITFRLPPYHHNFKKRTVKTPKLYFYDSALVCQLLGIDSAEHLQVHSARGNIFEGFVISEVIKQFYAKGKQAFIYFWQDHSGHEVDLLIDHGQQLLSLEIKSSSTFNYDFLRNLERWQKITKAETIRPCLIYTGSDSFNVNEASILNYAQIPELFE